MVTDTIETVTDTGIQTTRGYVLDADIIITATGLKMRFVGGVHVRVDDTLVKPADKHMWERKFLQDVRNTVFLQEYTNDW